MKKCFLSDVLLCAACNCALPLLLSCSAALAQPTLIATPLEVKRGKTLTVDIINDSSRRFFELIHASVDPSGTCSYQSTLLKFKLEPNKSRTYSITVPPDALLGEVGFYASYAGKNDSGSTGCEKVQIYNDEEGNEEGRSYFWISPRELALLPRSGAEFDNVLKHANTAMLDIVGSFYNQDGKEELYLLARAYAFHTTAEPRYRNEGLAAIEALAASRIRTNVSVLAPTRNLFAVLVAAQLLSVHEEPFYGEFRNWLALLLDTTFQKINNDGKREGPALTPIESARKRPNNFGPFAQSAVTAAAFELEDVMLMLEMAAIHSRWTGRDLDYKGFAFGDKSWQCNTQCSDGANDCAAINPVGCTRNGHNISGVLPDDQRRSGGFKWPPPKENYVWEALQGAVAQQQVLRLLGLGTDVEKWGESAILRAVEWLHKEADFRASGDDTWLPWVINCRFGGNYPTESAKLGKNMSFTDWTHAKGSPLCD